MPLQGGGALQAALPDAAYSNRYAILDGHDREIYFFSISLSITRLVSIVQIEKLDKVESKGGVQQFYVRFSRAGLKTKFGRSRAIPT